MIAAVLLAAAFPPPFVSIEVEKPVTGAGFSTSLETNGQGRAGQPAPVAALDAERAFAADAQTLGQWTGFAK